MRLQQLTLSLLLAALAAGCGKDKDADRNRGTQGAAQRVGGMTFADDASLPACDAATEGYLVYVTSTATFKTCDGAAWAAIDLKGPKGDDGTNDTAAAIEIYKKHRRSVFRATRTCSDPVIPQPSDCSPAGTIFGSAFLCGEGLVCTNRHVSDCGTGCFASNSLAFQALPADSDSLNAGADTIDPFVTVTSLADITYHTNGDVDLAKVKVTGVPVGITPMTLATDAASESISAMQSILSLSFPLGLLDLYVDVGAVNTAYIGECDRDGDTGQSAYDCPKAYYDFSTTNDTDHGSSGSPLIDIATGKVVGVTSAGTEGENANYTWAIDASKFSGID